MEVGIEIVVAAGVALTGAIGLLWQAVVKGHQTCREDYISVRDGREGDRQTLIELTGKVSHLEGSREGFMQGVDHVSQKVLDELHSFKDKTNGAGNE